MCAVSRYHCAVEFESDLDKALELTVANLSLLLIEGDLVVSTAESCTGGWIAQVLTSLAGSSAWFDTGFVTYSNEAKQRLLNVPADYFYEDAFGAVSEETVKAMTHGAIKNSLARVAVAVSGVAGPAGGSIEKPVGTVWIAWQWDEKTLAQCFQFPGDRRAIRAATVAKALEGLIDLLS
ncbi:MAG: nicotinamide-nucleotide amidase [Pseudohongiellaceae bacterium]|jgi:nicotinamide-nucleotide amidase